MGEQVTPQLLADSDHYEGTLSDFLARNLEAGYIGERSAERLMPILPYKDDRELRMVERRLADVDDKNLCIGQEVVAAALRQPDDFQPGDTVHARPAEPGSIWLQGTVEVTNNPGVTIRINDLWKITVPAFYTSLFNDQDNRLLHRHHRHPGIMSPAFFAVKLSFFDPRMAAWPELINNTARHYRPKPLKN